MTSLLTNHPSGKTSSANPPILKCHSKASSKAPCLHSNKLTSMLHKYPPTKKTSSCLKTLPIRKTFLLCPTKKNSKIFKSRKECTSMILKERPSTIKGLFLTLALIRKATRPNPFILHDKIKKTVPMKKSIKLWDCNLQTRKENSIQTGKMSMILFSGLKQNRIHFMKLPKIRLLDPWLKRIHAVCFLRLPLRHQTRKKPFETMLIPTVHVMQGKARLENWKKSCSAWRK